jgi:arylsulfatase A-like enzyme
MLIVTSDHGEELLEDKRCGHAVSLRDSLVHVPLVIHDPARFPAGAVVDDGVEAVDLLPTILAAVGRAAPPNAQGESLADGTARGWPRPVFAEMDEAAFAMRVGHWKARIGASGVPFVEDVAADPDELGDLAATHPIERRMLTDNLGLFLPLRTRWQKAAWGVTTNVTPAGAAALDAP